MPLLFEKLYDYNSTPEAYAIQVYTNYYFNFMDKEDTLKPSPEIQSPREVDLFTMALHNFQAHRDHIEASSKLQGVKTVEYDEEYLKQLVRDILRHRPANVRVWIGTEKDGEVIEQVIDSSLVAFQALSRGSDTIQFDEGDVNSSMLQYEIDKVLGLTDAPIEEVGLDKILKRNANPEDRPLSISIIYGNLDSPHVHIVAQNVVDGQDDFDQTSGTVAYINGLIGRTSTTFTMREPHAQNAHTVNIQKEIPGEDRVPGLDVQIGMLLFEQLGLSREEAGNLGELGPVYSKPKDVPGGDAF